MRGRDALALIELGEASEHHRITSDPAKLASNTHPALAGLPCAREPVITQP